MEIKRLQGVNALVDREAYLKFKTVVMLELDSNGRKITLQSVINTILNQGITEYVENNKEILEQIAK